MLKLKNTALKGGIFVALGAASYGMLTTFVKIANREGFTTFELAFVQYCIGLLGLILIDYLYTQKRAKTKRAKPTAKNIRNLVLAGCSLGVTSLVYYFSIQYISVSVAIVLLMQSVWVGVVLDAVFNKIKPDRLKILAIVIVLGGTVLATNLLEQQIKLDWRGISLGFLAALSYSITIFASNRIALEMPNLSRSKWMAVGGFVVVAAVCLPFVLTEFHPKVILKWGLILAVFGTALPPLCLTAGMPKVNLGIGSIITALELPIAVGMAYFILHEHVDLLQWIGIVLILLAVVMMNLKKLKRNKR